MHHRVICVTTTYCTWMITQEKTSVRIPYEHFMRIWRVPTRGPAVCVYPFTHVSGLLRLAELKVLCPTKCIYYFDYLYLHSRILYALRVFLSFKAIHGISQPNFIVNIVLFNIFLNSKCSVSFRTLFGHLIFFYLCTESLISFIS